MGFILIVSIRTCSYTTDGTSEGDNDQLKMSVLNLQEREEALTFS